MKNLATLALAIAMVAAACGGGSASCADIVDDGMVLFQDVIDEMDGVALTDLGDPFEDPEWEARADDLQQRTDEAGCTDGEMTDLFAEKLPVLTASDTNPGGQFLISFFNQAIASGTFDLGE